MSQTGETAVDIGELLYPYLFLCCGEIRGYFEFLRSCQIDYPELYILWCTEEQTVSYPSCLSRLIWKMECERELLALAWVEPVTLFCLSKSLPWVRPWGTRWRPAWWLPKGWLGQVWRSLHFLTLWSKDWRCCSCRDRISFHCRSDRRIQRTYNSSPY